MSRLYSEAERHILRIRQDPTKQDADLLRHRPILVLSMITMAVLALLRGQDRSWDVLNYHFYSGFALLHKPLNFDFAPAQVQSFFNPLMQVFSYLLLAHLPSRLANLLFGAVQGLNFYLLFQISQTLFMDWSNPLRFLLSFSNAVAGCYGAIFIAELGTSFGDNLNSILILYGFLLIFRYLQLNKNPLLARELLLGMAGALLGVAFALKLTVGIYVAAIVIALPVVLEPDRRLRAFLVFCGFLGFGFVAVYGFWGQRLYRDYQNPFFPYMNKLFRSSYYPPINVLDLRFSPRNWQQAIFYPFFFSRKNTLVSEMPFRDVRLALCYLAVVSIAAAGLLCLTRKSNATEDDAPLGHQRRNLTFLALFLLISYVLWEYQFSIYRYLIVLELLVPTFLAIALARFFKNKLRVFVLSLLLNAMICVGTVAPNFGRQRFDDKFLMVEVPRIGGLEESVVLMGGLEASSYIIPSFPARTRFVRIASNFLWPGQNSNLDRRIRTILAHYKTDHTFVYIAGEKEKERVRREVGFYGVKINDMSCRPVLSRTGDDGCICGTEEK